MALQQSTQEKRKTVQMDNNKADGVDITFYTDPLCCWSWAFEPQWRRLQFEFKEQIVFRYVMTGLLPSWKNYTDPVYSVSRPQQMGPVWMEASEASGMPMDSKIWVRNAPASSYPPCIAVKSVELQSARAAALYLRKLREAVMLQGQNISKLDVLMKIAENLAGNYPGLIDVNQLADDVTGPRGLEAFRADWQETQNRHITRTPTLILRSSQAPAIMMTGYRPYQVLLEAVKQVAPSIKAINEKISAQQYKQFWGELTPRELEEVL